MSSRDEAGSPNRRDEGSNAGYLALQNGEEVTQKKYPDRVASTVLKRLVLAAKQRGLCR